MLESMKKAYLITTLIIGVCFTSCRKRDESSAVKEITPQDKTRLVSLFDANCRSCHNNYSDENGKTMWIRLAARAETFHNKISAGQMPPDGMPAGEKEEMLALLKNVTDDIANTDLPLERIKLPEGFHIKVWAKVPGARSITRGGGYVVVGNGGFAHPHNDLYAVEYTVGAATSSGVAIRFGEGLNNPNGVAFGANKDDLYVAQRDRISAYPSFATNLKTGNLVAAQDVVTDFPEQDNHYWKYLRIDEGGNLYVGVGAPCNVCAVDAPGSMFGRIFKYDRIGNNKTLIAKGVRNTVGFDFHPKTKELWFTDNGRDRLGNTNPPDELNRITSPGTQHFGFPHCHGKNTVDPQFGTTGPAACSSDFYTKPAIELGAHVAALGMRFYKPDGVGEPEFPFPDSYKNQIFIAEHGSWDRNPPDGYKISLVKLNAEGTAAVSYETFASGWLNPDGTAWGRPVDIQMMPDGSMLVSDDKAGVVYRIWYEE
jgi:glucose/arabinose dehydrogenase